MGRLKKKTRRRLPRKLKKAILDMVSYYDGYFLTRGYLSKRDTKWKIKAFDIYHGEGHDYYLYDENFKNTRRGDIIDENIHKLYRRHCPPKWKPTAKWHKRNGEIFVYYKDGVVFPRGKWVKKVKPDDRWWKMKFYKDDKKTIDCYKIHHESYSYVKLGFYVVEKMVITEEEYKDESMSAKKLFDKLRAEGREIITIEQ